MQELSEYQIECSGVESNALLGSRIETASSGGTNSTCSYEKFLSIGGACS